jgi:hypothetical protein
MYTRLFRRGCDNELEYGQTEVMGRWLHPCFRRELGEMAREYSRDLGSWDYKEYVEALISV